MRRFTNRKWLVSNSEVVTLSHTNSEGSNEVAIAVFMMFSSTTCNKLEFYTHLVKDRSTKQQHRENDISLRLTKFCKLNPNYSTPPLGQDMTQGQFLSGV